MRIIRNTPDLLIAEEVPWLIAILLFLFTMTFLFIGLAIAASGVWEGLIFALTGGGLGFAAICGFVERLQLVLDAQSDRVVIRRRTIWQQRETVLPLHDVIHATEERSPGTRPMTRAALVTADAKAARETVHPVTEIYGSGREAARLVRIVNEWLIERSGRVARP